MKRVLGIVRNERGGGLLMALLVIVALAAIAASIISAVSTDRRITSYTMTRAEALNFASAGVAEALERIRSNDVPDNRNPKMVAQIYLTGTGDVPSVGADTTAMATAQPAGDWLPYSSDKKGPDVLTIQYMTNATRTGIYYYDSNKNPPIQGKTGDPVFLVTSPAHIGVTRRQVDAMVTKITIDPNLKGAYVGHKDVKFHGTDIANGNDYSADTPSGTGADGKNNPTWQTGKAAAAGVWSGKKADIKAPSIALGSPASVSNGAGFYSGPWDVLNMSQAEFWSWLGPPSTKVKDNAPLPSGITYLSKKGDKPQKGTHKYRLSGGNGDGFLYVNGDLEIAGDFVFRGLIYVEGDVVFKGTGWVLGCVVVDDHSETQTSHHEVLTVLKSIEAVQQFIAKSASPFVTISWRES